MHDTRLIMGMPISIELDDKAPASLMETVYDYFQDIDRRFSLYKPDSEISAFNRGSIKINELSDEMHEVLALSARTQRESNNYFRILRPDGILDPSGIVKGWAVKNAGHIIRNAGIENYYVDAGGDIQTGGKNHDGREWAIGIRNPFNDQEIIKVIAPRERGVATSGSYVRGDHIYNPLAPHKPITEIVSLTVIGPDVLEADRFATAAFAMGEDGIYFIESLSGFEGFVVSKQGMATQTTGFGDYVIE